MANAPPEYCPRCGERLDPVDPPGSFYCHACDGPTFHNPVPAARLAVLDGDHILLVKVDAPDRDLWGTPGGMLEPEEQPAAAGARELTEETTLEVDPDALTLFDVRTFKKFDRFDKLYLAFAVDAADVRGIPTADDEVVEARFWAREEFASAEARLLTSWPREYKDLSWWIENAQAALDGESLA